MSKVEERPNVKSSDRPDDVHDDPGGVQAEGPAASAPVTPHPMPEQPDKAIEKFERVNAHLDPPFPPSVSTQPTPTTEDPPMERQLNVTDALSYLDSVKTKFQENPEVYNRFLDIMKDFKAQLIDTPGVIERVSNLFHGHPSLIQGFNTFLPAGYRIECTDDASNPNTITVTTPAGTTTQATNGAFTFGPGTSRPPSSQLPPGDVQHAEPSVNLEPALAYLQRVKSRYANEPEKYRRFLEILKAGPVPGHNAGAGAAITGHDTRALEEWAVAFLSAGYAQGEVAQRMGRLFLDAPSLMKDFVEFLPDKHLREAELTRLAEIQEPRKAVASAGESKSAKKKAEGATGATGSGTTVPQKRKRKPAEREKEKDKEKEREKDMSAKAGPSKVKKARLSQAHGADVSSPSLGQRHAAVPLSPRRSAHAHPSTHGHQHGRPPSLPPPAPVAAAPLPPPPLSPIDETQFFERVKRMLDNRETYNEFLKLVNLFTQDVIDTARLVRDSRRFLGDTDVMVQFMEILGWDERRDRIAVADDIWTRPMVALDRPSRDQLSIRYGSYRKLPPQEANVSCSGRDEMCRSVLNDEWIAQPTFASEDGGFHVHMKNPYEEALLRSEEERHEYDFHIEAIHRTIQMLEPLNNKILQLSMEERNNFKLKPNLGGAGKSVHLRVLKKIYGRDAGYDVFQAMQEVPALSIPIVLARLKVKHDEWKRAQREWNKVWREVDARNYHKSLDHQGVTFRVADKKALTAKAFLNQIEAAKTEQMATKASYIDPLFARARPAHQLEFVIDDMDVVQDALKLTFSFLDRTQDQIALSNRKKIETFLRAFVPLFFAQDQAAFNSAFVPHQETLDSDMEVDSIADDADAISVGSRPGKNGRKAGSTGFSGDLRKRLLKSEQAKSSRRTRTQDAASPSTSRPTSPAISDVMQIDGIELGTNTEPIAGPSNTGAISQAPARRQYTFFTNANFYVFFRLFETLYSRLHRFKVLAQKLASEPVPPHKPNPTAVDLGILNDFSLYNRQPNPAHFYVIMLGACEKLFDNEIEQQVFEDQLRMMFGPRDAYKLFTIDRVVGSVIKQVQNILLDARSQDLYDILRKEREMASVLTHDLNGLRLETEEVIGSDESLYRMDWFPEKRTVTIQLLGKDDPNPEDPELVNGRWQAYVESYVADDETRDIIMPSSRRPYLQRYYHSTISSSPAPEEPDIIVDGGLKIKVCVRTYRLFYMSHSEDFLCRVRSAGERELLQKRLRVQDARRLAWLEKFAARDDQGSSSAKDAATPSEATPPPDSTREGTSSATEKDDDRPPQTQQPKSTTSGGSEEVVHNGT
ncbi:uncharacterized protein LAESUDRAFT_698018 [Laetiporus sulphureus 93-53]|uniref:Histone deacetylase interacting domain-containing protein n=1 Tax=Laetiporus sulphureus 93-53 TaxID=1314785 RepID=A0A165EY02_9APHY|nr:uncharacterized protein LAESUDRAFT_698018 [Laetiporus sulphureus 93-53]KZT07953.1 hypothetical protein LAESUDRAFT_698018 [Laetiporus sulphureus 93-53]